MEHSPSNRREERRKASRISMDEEVARASVQIHPGDDMLVPVTDESLGGIGVVVDDATPFPVGGEVGIAYAHSFFHATVIHVRERSDGKFVVGFQVRESARDA